jgi:ABC-type glutathione transport system ATPase component
MSDWTWVLHDAAGSDLRSTETFATRDDAEAWMTSHWAGLLEEGAEKVSLMDDGTVVYKMGLREE